MIDVNCNSANKICNHIFNLLGSGDVSLGKDIKWNEDFKTGFIWKNEFYKKIKKVDLNNNADIKVPWELSRFQYIPTLGQAYLSTNDLKYALEFKNQIEDWIEKNPIEMSVNWTCTMDVAIRVCNWIAGYSFFKDCPNINKEFWIKYNEELYSHGEYIFNNLENKSEYKSNHYLSNLAGLIYLGIYLNNSIWLDFGLEEFEKEMKNQVNPDGTDYEASIAYHCLVTEIFLFASILCSKNNITFSKGYMTKLEKMIEFIMDITKPNGLIPLIGDMDSGRFIILTGYGITDKRDFRYLITKAGEFFKRDDFINFPSVNTKSKAYKNGGYYILKDDRVYLIIRCGANGMNDKKRSSHTHNDQLSFELNISGKDFIVDPGTYVYTADYKLRNLFRSTYMHNTLQVEDLEQNSFKEREVFVISNETNAQLLNFSNNYFKGRHYGFKDKAEVIIEREVKLKDNKILINDFIIKDINDTEYKNVIRFHLDKEVEVKEENNCLILNNKEVKIKISNLQKNKYNIEKSWMSKEYGIKEESKVINCEIKDSIINTIIEIL